MTFPFGETVTLHTRTVSGRDADGNDVYTDVPTVLVRVPVWPRGSTENPQGADTVITGYTALLPVGTDVDAIDKVTRSGNRDYEVEGEPGEFLNPFTGTNPGVLVNLRRVTG